MHVTKSFLKYAFIVIGLTLATSASSYGMVFHPKPEIDPGMAIGGLTLLAGSLVVLRARHKK